MKVSLRRRCRLIALVSLLALPGGAVSVADASGDRGTQTTERHNLPATTGIRAIRLAKTPLSITNAAVEPGTGGRGVRILSVSVENPGPEEVAGVALYWSLYDDRDAEAPVADGTTTLHRFERPLRIHDSGTVPVDVDVPTPDAEANYTLHIGIEGIAYKDGKVWIRTAPAGKPQARSVTAGKEQNT